MSNILEKLPQEKLVASIELLGLPIRPCRCLQRAGIHSIEQLLQLDPDKLRDIRNLGVLSYDVILDTTSQYLGLSTQDLQMLLEENKDRESASVERPRLPDKIAALPISILSFSPRPYNALRRNGIETLQELYEAQLEGFVGIRGVGETSSEEIMRIFQAFLEQAEDLTFEELEHARDSCLEQPTDSRSVLIDVGSELPNLVEFIESITKKILFALGKERDFEVLKYRYGLEGCNAYKLDEIAKGYYDTSRQRIQQIEARGLNTVRSFLLGDSQSEEWRLPQEVITEAHNLTSDLKACDVILIEPKIVKILEARYGFVFLSKYERALFFLLDLLGFKRLATTAAGIVGIDIYSTWIISQNIENGQIYEAIKVLRSVLRESALALSLFDIMVQVNHRRKRKLTVEYMKLAARICKEVEEISPDVLQIKLEYLPSVADKAYRVLHEQGKPMRSSDIIRIINQHLVKAGLSHVQARSLTSQLAIDSRFEPIGRGGEWSLAEWDDVCRDTILEVIEECFHFHGKAITTNQVYEYVISKRPDVSKNSITGYLSGRKDKFVKTDDKKYELVSWGTKSTTQKKPLVEPLRSGSLLSTHIPKIFEEADVIQMPLNELIKELVKKTGLKEVTIYTAIRKSPMVEMLPDPKNSRRRIAKYIACAEIVVHKTKRELIQQEIEFYLKQQLDKRALVSDVAKHTIRATQCKREMFYGSLSRMTSVKKEKIGNQLYCSLMVETISSTPFTFPSIEKVADLALKDNILRAVNHLTVENVDIGLFQLGKILETELKAFLFAVQSKSVFPVTRNDLSRFVSMIDCVEQNGIIKNKHHLTLLREERNERAHGDIPTLSEREDLMKQAPHLAGLFIEYIVFFHAKRLDL